MFHPVRNLKSVKKTLIIYHLVIVFDIQFVCNITENVKPWMANENLAFRVRSTVCRGPTNKAVATQVNVFLCQWFIRI